MRYTHLDIVQLILSAMDSDNVNSISDTEESNQVSLLLRSVYYDCATDLGLPEHETVFQLNASGDAAKPVLMTVPTNIVTVRSIQYDSQVLDDTQRDYKEVVFMPFPDFLKMQSSLNLDESTVDSMEFNGDNLEDFELLFRNDKAPNWFTSFDDNTVLFDSYDSEVDTTLQKSKTLCMGVVYPEYDLEDTFEPDLDPSQFSYFINRAKVRAFAELKQAPNQEAASETRRQKIIVQKRKRKTPDQLEIHKAPRYGRR